MLRKGIESREMNSLYLCLILLIFSLSCCVGDSSHLGLSKASLLSAQENHKVEEFPITQAVTDVPTLAPTVSPSRKPTRRPTERKSIYGDFSPDEVLEYSAQQDTVIVLIIAIFVLMALEVASPEIIMLTALMIVIFCEILTLSEGLAGMRLLFL